MRCIQQLLKGFADAIRAQEITEDEAADLLRGLAHAIGPMTVTVMSDTEQQRARARDWKRAKEAIEKQMQSYAKQHARRLDALLLRLASVLRDQEKVPSVEELAEALQANHEDASIVRRRFLWWSDDLYLTVKALQERRHRFPTLRQVMKVTEANLNKQDVRAILTIIATAKKVVKEDVYTTLQPFFNLLEVHPLDDGERLLTAALSSSTASETTRENGRLSEAANPA